MELNTPIAGFNYIPWPVAGSTIWEEPMFRNQDYTYTVAVIAVRDTDGSPEEKIIV